MCTRAKGSAHSGCRRLGAAAAARAPLRIRAAAAYLPSTHLGGQREHRGHARLLRPHRVHLAADHRQLSVQPRLAPPRPPQRLPQRVVGLEQLLLLPQVDLQGRREASGRTRAAAAAVHRCAAGTPYGNVNCHEGAAGLGSACVLGLAHRQPLVESREHVVRCASAAVQGRCTAVQPNCCNVLACISMVRSCRSNHRNRLALSIGRRRYCCSSVRCGGGGCGAPCLSASGRAAAPPPTAAKTPPPPGACCTACCTCCLSLHIAIGTVTARPGGGGSSVRRTCSGITFGTTH